MVWDREVKRIRCSRQIFSTDLREWVGFAHIHGMSRAIAFLAVLALLTLRFIDGTAHDHAHMQDASASVAMVVQDADAGCGSNDFHAAAHCASHMADSMQREHAAPMAGEPAVRNLVPVTWSVLNDGRILSPPVRPPLA